MKMCSEFELELMGEKWACACFTKAFSYLESPHTDLEPAPDVTICLIGRENCPDVWFLSRLLSQDPSTLLMLVLALCNSTIVTPTN